MLFAWSCAAAAAPTAQMVPVADGVSLEVLDWGGHGSALVFLAGLGRTAHDFDDFAPAFTKRHHVYGITRRGYGASSKPPATEANYAADRLGDDVLAVLAALKLDHPVLAGHSMAGEEMSSIATRHPLTVAGLVYLDAGQSFALYDPEHGDIVVDLNELRRRLNRWDYSGVNVAEDERQTRDILDSRLLILAHQGLEQHLRDLEPYKTLPPQPMTEQAAIGNAVMQGERKFTDLGGVPVLAIYASPHDVYRNPTPQTQAAADADLALAARQSALFEAAGAKIVRLPYASHFVWRTHRAEVLRAMEDFLGGLSRNPRN